MPTFPLAAASLAAALCLPCPAHAAVPPLAVERIADGLTNPTAIAHAGDERLFVTLQDGRVLIFRDGQLVTRPFLDIRGRVLDGGERGLLSIAFHPAFAANGFVYVNYTGEDGGTVVSRFQVADDPDFLPPDSERVLLRIAQPFANHNGGQLQFGPDGYLYVGMGDGGSANDPQCRAQDDTTLLGKMLRLDVDQSIDAPPFHGIPPTNPYVGSGPPRDEIWAEGLRNPWRFSFDRLTGDLWIGDVGQGQREEVSFQPAASLGGENYGWKLWEGDLCLGNTAGCGFPVPGCNSPVYTAPIVTYDQGGGRCAVIGGTVYRGARIPALAGFYLYGDLCAGTVWAGERAGSSFPVEVLPFTLPGLTTFGEDAAGELYLAAGDGLYRLTGPALPATCTPGPTTLCLQNGRFLVEARRRPPQSGLTPAAAEPLTPDAGFFWFGNPDNPELFVKVLDACAPFDRWWVFAAGLTNVETRITVLDTLAGQVRAYDNPQGRAFVAVQDTAAFATCP